MVVNANRLSVPASRAAGWVRGYIDKPHARARLLVEPGQKTQHAPRPFRLRATRLQCNVEFRGALEKRCRIDIEQMFRYEAFDLDPFRIERVPRASREDQQLARDIGAAEIEPRIGLGIAERMRLAQQRRERPVAVEVVEQP